MANKLMNLCGNHVIGYIKDMGPVLIIDKKIKIVKPGKNCADCVDEAKNNA